MKRASIVVVAAFVACFAPVGPAYAQDDTANQAFIQSLGQADPDLADYLALANHSLTLRCGRAPSVRYLRKIAQDHVPTIVPDGHASDRAQVATLSCDGQPDAAN
jgi:hypothetical protein